jgi:regulatory protein
LANTLRARALAMLARREMSRAELRKKLEPLAADSGTSAAELDQLLDSLIQSNFQSDKRYSEALAHHRARRFGAGRIAQELREKGVSPELTAEAVRELRGNEEARALDVWRRKFSTLAATAEERAKQGRFLMSRGFSADVVRRVIGGKAGDDDVIEDSE